MKIVARWQVICSFFCLFLNLGPNLCAQSNYSSSRPLEYYVGPILAPSRPLGLGGAQVGLAEYVEGSLFNPAAVANRGLWSSASSWAFDFMFESTSDLAKNDIELEQNLLEQGSDAFSYQRFGIMLQRKSLGASVILGGPNFSQCSVGAKCSKDASDYFLNGFDSYFALGRAVLENRLVWGLSASSSNVRIETPSSNIASLHGYGLGLGLLYKPKGQDYRLGFAAKLPFRRRVHEKTNLGMVVTPNSVRSPLEFTIGVSYFFGHVHFNSKKQKPAQEWLLLRGSKRRYYLLVADLNVVWKQSHTVGIESWFNGLSEPTGQKISFNPRAGFETEVWPERLKLRSGIYWESSRFQRVSGRLHGTVGFDLRLARLFSWWNWQFTAAFDYSKNYQNITWSIVSFWR